MADINVTPEVVEDVEIDLEAKAKEYEASSKANNSGEYQLTTDIKNFSKGRVHKVETHFWNGRTLTNFPALPINTGVAMRQAGPLPKGVKWGIVYADGEDTTARKFIVAVDGPSGKIYVEAGPIGPVDWNVVEVKLDQHSGSKAETTDPILGGKIVAQVTGTYAVARFNN
ncbi:uncharacterized protein [Spinacia oleracea]|uniref:Uncharacterized protein n=1 Tax=Spinacia oleracea TaxID=3562 RepID=A0A9R0I100_SPIOL|nr:uncharacterized protein LOC110780542 [Spinacia oleracea]